MFKPFDVVVQNFYIIWFPVFATHQMKVISDEGYIR